MGYDEDAEKDTSMDRQSVEASGTVLPTHARLESFRSIRRL